MAPLGPFACRAIKRGKRLQPLRDLGGAAAQSARVCYAFCLAQE
jgi:hypothetical protein